MSWTDAELARLSFAAYSTGHIIQQTDAEIAVGIRGSQVIDDWLQDILVLEINHCALGRVHEGFLAGANILAPKVREAARGRPIVLTGHSRGGAIATVLGALLAASGSVVSAIVTFGAPRAGCEPMAEILSNVPVREYRCGDDPVPYWPDPPFRQMRGLLQIGTALINPLADHPIHRYLESLDGAAAGQRMAG